MTDLIAKQTIRFSVSKVLCVGVLVGVFLTLGLLTIWGKHLDSVLYENAQPTILRPLNRSLPGNADSPDLPNVWLPGPLKELDQSWELMDMSGKKLRLSDYRGRVMFLNFWSTTCTPCIEEMPAIRRLEESLHDEPIRFLLVSFEPLRDVQHFSTTSSLSSLLYVGAADVPNQLKFQGFPTTFVLNADGAAVFKQVGAANWDSDTARGYLRSLARR